MKKLKLGAFITKGLSTVGKSAAAKNAELASDLAATRLKTKFTLQEVASKAKALSSNKMINVVKSNLPKRTVTPQTAKLVKTSQLASKAKLGSALGLGLVAGAAAYGAHRIIKARKEVDKAAADTGKAVKDSAQKSLEFGAMLRKRKQETGMSLFERKIDREKKEEAKRLKRLEGLKSVVGPSERKR